VVNCSDLLRLKGLKYLIIRTITQFSASDDTATGVETAMFCHLNIHVYPFCQGHCQVILVVVPDFQKYRATSKFLGRLN